MKDEGGRMNERGATFILHPSALILLVLITFFACTTNAANRTRAVAPGDEALLDDVERRSFHYFWDLADPATHLIPDRAPTPSFSSIAAVGFGLTAYSIGAERGFVTRAAPAQPTLATIQSMLALKHGAAATRDSR